MPDDAKVMLGARIPAGLHRQLKMMSVETGEPLATLTERAIEALVEKHRKKKRRQ